jgi:hypothetical protein
MFHLITHPFCSCPYSEESPFNLEYLFSLHLPLWYMHWSLLVWTHQNPSALTVSQLKDLHHKVLPLFHNFQVQFHWNCCIRPLYSKVDVREPATTWIKPSVDSFPALRSERICCATKK